MKFVIEGGYLLDYLHISLLYWVFGLSGPSDPGSQKIFNQLNLLLLKVQSLGSYTNYFQWFMDYLKHFDLLMPHVHVLKKLPYCLMST